MRDNQGGAWGERSRESSPPPSPPSADKNLCCVHEIDDWMLVNRLKLNKDKTSLPADVLWGSFVTHS